MQAVSGLKAAFGQLEVEWKGEVHGAKAQAQALQSQLAAVQARMSELAGRLLSEINKADQLRQCSLTQAEVSSYTSLQVCFNCMQVSFGCTHS